MYAANNASLADLTRGHTSAANLPYDPSQADEMLYGGNFMVASGFTPARDEWRSAAQPQTFLRDTRRSNTGQPWMASNHAAYPSSMQSVPMYLEYRQNASTQVHNGQGGSSSVPRHFGAMRLADSIEDANGTERHGYTFESAEHNAPSSSIRSTTRPEQYPERQARSRSPVKRTDQQYRYRSR